MADNYAVIYPGSKGQALNEHRAWLEDNTRPFWLQLDDYMEYGIYRYLITRIDIEDKDVNFKSHWEGQKNDNPLIGKNTFLEMLNDLNPWLFFGALNRDENTESL